MEEGTHHVGAMLSGRVKSHDNGLIHQLVVEVWYLQFPQAANSFVFVTRRQEFLQKQIHLCSKNVCIITSPLDQLTLSSGPSIPSLNPHLRYCVDPPPPPYLPNEEHDWSLAATHSPDIVKSSQPMLHGDQYLCPLHGSTNEGKGSKLHTHVCRRLHGTNVRFFSLITLSPTPQSGQFSWEDATLWFVESQKLISKVLTVPLGL